jgi:hypothetical protein
MFRENSCLKLIILFMDDLGVKFFAIERAPSLTDENYFRDGLLHCDDMGYFRTEIFLT